MLLPTEVKMRSSLNQTLDCCVVQSTGALGSLCRFADGTELGVPLELAVSWERLSLCHSGRPSHWQDVGGESSFEVVCWVMAWQYPGVNLSLPPYCPIYTLLRLLPCHKKRLIYWVHLSFYSKKSRPVSLWWDILGCSPCGLAITCMMSAGAPFLFPQQK